LPGVDADSGVRLGRFADPLREGPAMSPPGWFAADRAEHEALAAGWVVPEPTRCVQCGICSFNCPMAIDVRRYVWRGEPVKDSYCLTCGECVQRCPRRLLRFELIWPPERGRPGRKVV